MCSSRSSCACQPRALYRLSFTRARSPGSTPAPHRTHTLPSPILLDVFPHHVAFVRVQACVGYHALRRPSFINHLMIQYPVKRKSAQGHFINFIRTLLLYPPRNALGGDTGAGDAANKQEPEQLEGSGTHLLSPPDMQGMHSFRPSFTVSLFFNCPSCFLSRQQHPQ